MRAPNGGGGGNWRRGSAAAGAAVPVCNSKRFRQPLRRPFSTRGCARFAPPAAQGSGSRRPALAPSADAAALRQSKKLDTASRARKSTAGSQRSAARGHRRARSRPVRREPLKPCRHRPASGGADCGGADCKSARLRRGGLRRGGLQVARLRKIAARGARAASRARTLAAGGREEGRPLPLDFALGSKIALGSKFYFPLDFALGSKIAQTSDEK